MSRLNKLDEMIELAMLLQNSYQGLTIDEMIEKLEKPRRSVERLKALIVDKFGDKLEELPPTWDKKKRWRFKKGAMNFLISFKPEDFALLNQLKELSNNKNTQKQVDELIAKIKALTPQSNMLALDNDVETLLSSQSYSVRQYPHQNIDLDLVNKIQECILADKKLKINFRGNDKDWDIILYPYGFLFGEYTYLVALEDGFDKVKLYTLSKISNPEVLEEYFEKDESFNLKEYCEKSFGVWNCEPFEVELLFNKDVREDVLNYHFHSTQNLEVQKDGSVKVSFKASGETEICWNLFKWGTNVEILSPKNLQITYKNMLENILKKQK